MGLTREQSGQVDEHRDRRVDTSEGLLNGLTVVTDRLEPAHCSIIRSNEYPVDNRPTLKRDMYVPRQFALSDEETEAALAQGGFAQLVTHGPSGLMVTPLPLLYDQARHSLLGHVSRANPHWHATGGESVAIFTGPQAYISPSFYATKSETGKVVPTWNYEVLNVYGRLVAHDDPDWVLKLVTKLTNHHEEGRTEPWQVTDAPETFTRAQLKAIVGVELEISRVEGKAKMSQNQPERNRTGVVAGLKESGEAADHVVADRVASLGNTNANGRG
jgi:transcriptional regulator